jgi:hypothetical protein
MGVLEPKVTRNHVPESPSCILEQDDVEAPDHFLEAYWIRDPERSVILLGSSEL